MAEQEGRQVRTATDQPLAHGEHDKGPRSTGAHGPAGDAAVRRIVDADPDLALPSYEQVLTMLLGSVAAAISPADVPSEIAIVAQEIIVELMRAAAASTESEKTSSDGGAHAGGGGAHAGGGGGAARGNKGGPAARGPQLDVLLDALIADKIAHVIEMVPKAQALAQKLRDFDTAHPGLILEALVLAAMAALGRDAKLPAFNHTFTINEAWAVKAGVQLGTLRHIALSAINASIEHKTKGLSASLGVSRDVTANTTTASAQVTVEDLHFLHMTIDQAMLSYKHVDAAGKRPTDQIMEQLAFKLHDVGFKFTETNTWAEQKKPSAGRSGGASSGGGRGGGGGRSSGGSGKNPGAPATTTPAAPAAPAGRVMNAKLSEQIDLPAWNNFKLSLDSTQNFGPNAPGNSYGANLKMPEINGWKSSLNFSKTEGQQATLGGKLTFPTFNDITVSVGENLPVGPGSGHAALSLDIDFKGVKLSIKQVSGGGGKGGSSGSAIADLGNFSQTHGGWTVGISIPIGKGR